MLAPKDGGQTGDVRAAAAAGVESTASKLPHMAAIQQSFGGYDISNVQAHLDGNANDATTAMGANAYAIGNDVVLGDRGKDLHTVAHETAHVVQQRAGVQLSGGVGKSGDVYEKNADAVADRVVQGKSAVDLLGQVGGSNAAQTEGIQLKEGDPEVKDAEVKNPEVEDTDAKDDGAKDAGPKKKWLFGGKKQATPKHDASGFSDKQKKQLAKACVAALPMVKRALAKAKKGSSLYKTWMDNSAKEDSVDGAVDTRIAAVQACLTKVQSCLENDEIKFQKYALNDGEEDETYAYVHPSEADHNIYLGGAFWSFWTWTKGKNSKAGTIIHELTHRLHNTSDHAYGTGGCKKLAKNSPDLATTNADNFEYLCESA